MFLRKIFFSILVTTFSILIFYGCGGEKETLSLPEKEIRQLEIMDENISEGEGLSARGKPALVSGGKKFYVYADKGYFKNHFVPSGWMGDYGDIKFNDGWTESPYSRRSCIKIIYTAERKLGGGWAGVYWQEPANNWGNLPGGYDLTGAKHLKFYARGAKGGEVITEFKLGGIQGEYSDSTASSIGPVVLTPEWEEYSIDLENQDLSNVIGGFSFIVSAMENPDGATFYIDEITYE